jgi:hypothetical protein
MRKTRVKKLRKEFEQTIQHLSSNDKLRNSDIYKTGWRKFKKEYYVLSY